MEFIDGLPPEKVESQKDIFESKQHIFDKIRKYEKDEVFLYKLTIEGHTKAQVIESNFGMTCMNELTFLEYDKTRSWWRFRLKELSYHLDKYEDPVMVQIIEMSNKISEIYQELDFWVNNWGEMQVVNNRSQIQKRWEKVREYLTYKHPLSSFEIIMAKEHEMANPKVELNNLRFIHFIHLYFFQFGRLDFLEKFAVKDMDRFGSGVAFDISIAGKREDKEGKIHRHFEGRMFDNGEAAKAMRKAVKDDNADVIYKTRADYHNDGLIVEEANFSFIENIGDSYSMYSNLHLTLESDGR